MRLLGCWRGKNRRCSASSSCSRRRVWRNSLNHYPNQYQSLGAERCDWNGHPEQQGWALQRGC